MFVRIAIIIVLLLAASFGRLLVAPPSLLSFEPENFSAYQASFAGQRYLVAKVFSTYPFNYKNEIIINAGLADGVKEGMAVLAGPQLLLGKINKVLEAFSSAQTVFDPRWQLPVRIGAGGIDALLVGGVEPRLTLIAAGKNVSPGETVYTASAGLPYGLKIGQVKSLASSPNTVFKEATLDFPYSFNELREVLLK